MYGIYFLSCSGSRYTTTKCIGLSTHVCQVHERTLPGWMSFSFVLPAQIVQHCYYVKRTFWKLLKEIHWKGLQHINPMYTKSISFVLAHKK